MKKTYIAPSMLTTEIKTDIIAASLDVSDETVNTQTPGAQLGNAHNGGWNDIWGE